MNSPKIWLEMTIAGFVFLLAAFFFALAFFHITDLSFIQQFSSATPYLSVAIVFLSYIVGLSIHIVSQTLLSSDKDTSKTRADAMFNDKIPERAIRLVETSYSTFVLFRLLSVGTYFLGMALLAWSCHAEFMRYVVIVAIFCFALSAISLCVYAIIKKHQSQLKQQFNDSFNDSTNKQPPQAAAHNKRQTGARTLDRRG